MVTPVAWVRDGRGFDWPRILLVALAVTVVVAVGIASAVSTAPFNPYSPTWEGTSDLRADLDDDPDVDLVVLRSADGYDRLDGSTTVAFVVAPIEPYDAAAVAAMSRYLERGGTLVVMENVGPYANPLLADLGADARVDGRILQDEREYAQGPLMPIASVVDNATRDAGAEQLTLNVATAVSPGEGTVLVETSPYAYLGAIDDEIDDDTELAAYPVASTEGVGAGTVVLVGDPSITINAMLGEPDNRAFIAALIGDADVVAWDASHGPALPPTRQALLFLGDSPPAQVVLGLGLVGVVVLLGARGDWLANRLRRRDELDERIAMTDAERVAYLARRNPDWDEATIERVVGGINRSDGQPEDETR